MRGLRNSRAPISGFDSPSRASCAICRSCGGQVFARLERPLAHLLAGRQAARCARARRTPPSRSTRTARARCGAARARPRGDSRDATTRRRAGARGRARDGAGYGPAARSPLDTSARRLRRRSTTLASAPGSRAPSRWPQTLVTSASHSSASTASSVRPTWSAASISSGSAHAEMNSSGASSAARWAHASASLVAAKSVVQDRSHPLGPLHADPLAPGASVMDHRVDQRRGLAFASPQCGEQQRRRSGADASPVASVTASASAISAAAAAKSPRHAARFAHASDRSAAERAAPASRATCTCRRSDRMPAVLVPEHVRRDRRPSIPSGSPLLPARSSDGNALAARLSTVAPPRGLR